MINTLGGISMKRVGIYGRVSTDGQKENTSIPEQKEKLLAYCKAKSWLCTDMFIDPGYSGSTLKRPAMDALIQAVEEKRIDVVLVTKLDRLSRSQKDTLYLIEDVFLPNGVDFVSVSESLDTSTSYGRAMIGILSAFAQLERENIKERTFGGRVSRAKDGLWHGGGPHPIGYDYIDGELVTNKEEAKQVRMVYEYYASGHSITSICDKMQGYTTKHGDWHHPSTVAAVLDNKLYAGIIHFDDVEATESYHDAIIPKDLFDKVQSIRRSVYGYPQKDSKYLLTGLVYCANCNARYFLKKNPNKNEFYCCHSRAKVNKAMVKDKTCKNKNWPRAELEKYVLDTIREYHENPHLLYEIKKEPMEIGPPNKVQEDINQINGEISRLMDLYQTNDTTLQVDNVAERINELYQRKITLINMYNHDKDKGKGLQRDFSVESAKLVIADIMAATVNEENLQFIRYSLMRLLKKITIDGDKISLQWSFI